MKKMLILAGALTASTAALAQAEGSAVTRAHALQAGAQDLVARYVAWRGGDAFRRNQAAHAVGALKVGGLQGRIDRWSDRAGFSREIRDLGVFKVQEVIGPMGAWSVSPSGQVSPVAAAEQTDEHRAAAVVSCIDLGGSNGATVSRLADEARGGRSWGVLRATYADGDTYDLLIDPATGELGFERMVQDHRTTVVAFSDWRVVDGARFAFREDAESEVPLLNRHVGFSTLTTAAAVPAEVLTRPAARKVTSFVDGANSSGWLPFQLVGGRRIFLDVQLGDRHLSAMLDSGAVSSVIDATAAKRLGIEGLGHSAVIGVAATSSMSIAKGADLRIGNVGLKALPLAVIDLSDVSSRIGHPIDMVIGKEVLEELVVDVDFVRRRLALSSPEGFQASPGAVPLALDQQNGVRVLHAGLTGAADAIFQFDLGNGSPLVLYGSQPATATVLKGRRTGEALVGGVGGNVTAKAFTLPALTVAGASFHDVPTLVMPPSAGVSGSTRVLGNLGLPVFQRFALTIDYPHDRLWLRQLRSSIGKPFPKDRAGLSVQPQGGGLAVALVARGSAAETAGLRVGDRIVAINGVAISPDYAAARISDWRFGPAGRVVALRLADGSVRRLRLADYY